MEIVHVTSGLPWFWTIIVSTLLSRVVLFPFSVIALRNSAKMIPYQPQLNALREQMNASRGNQLLMQKALLQQKKLYEKIGVSIGSMAIMPFIQLPVTLGMFFGVKSMCDLPVEQLKWSGLSFLPDLTVADPTMTLPILAAVAMNFQLSLGLRDMTPAPHMPHLINLFRVLTTASVFLMMNLPSGVLVYIVTSIVGIMAQTAILRVPAVRRVLGIPIIPKTQTLKPASMRESLAYAKKWWEQQKRDAELKAKASQRR
ncbi:hypothetical protein K474DRAFT_1596816 [Panus rudis PR-1116 ss-1]|nr:hypothetical protein K474DRAFT_1596816 [Panus rudis PR-1116 ss-1]